MKKQKLLISFSGGETSAFMTQWLWKNKQDTFEMLIVFANTGQENEETLKFVERCSNYFGFPVWWVEADVDMKKGVGTKHKIVDFKSASRLGEPFEAVIKKYGIPNQSFPHCTRETKLSPITSFSREYFKTRDYYTAVGIRADEVDRISKVHLENKIIYPLIDGKFIPATKPQINTFWRDMPFRLNLAGYQGNCKTCWKKSDKKLFKIANEDPNAFQFNLDMETLYGRVGSEFEKRPENPNRTFFRRNRSTMDILEQAFSQDDWCVTDDSQEYVDLVGGESCEIWAECGN